MKYLERLLLLGFMLAGAAGCCAETAKSEKGTKPPLENVSQPDNMKSLAMLKQLINNVNALILSEQSLSKIKELFKKIISHNKADKIAANFDRAINIVQYYMFNLANHKEALLYVLGEMKKAVSKLSEARYWGDIKTALDGFSPFKKVNFWTSDKTPGDVRDGVNNIVDALNTVVAKLKTVAQDKAKEEKQIISDSAKNIFVAKASKDVRGLKESIEKLSNQISNIPFEQIQIEAGKITQNMEKLIISLGQAPETTILKEIEDVLEGISKSKIGWGKLYEKSKSTLQLGKHDIIPTDDLKNITLSYNRLLSKLSTRAQEVLGLAKKADAKERVEALIEALHKLVGVVPLEQIKTETAQLAGKVTTFISLLGQTPEITALKDIKATLESISQSATTWKNLENLINLKKKISISQYITVSKDDFDKLVEATYNLIETLYGRAHLTALKKNIIDVFTNLSTTNEDSFKSSLTKLKKRAEETIKKIAITDCEQLKDLVTKLEKMSNAGTSHLKDLKELIKVKIDLIGVVKANKEDALTAAIMKAAINNLIAAFNKSCDDLQKRIKTKTTLLLDVLAAGEKLRATIERLRATISSNGDKETAEGELKTAITALQTDPDALKALKEYPEALLAATAEIKEPKTAEETINFKKMLTQFERYVRILMLINDKIPILSAKITEDFIVAAFHGRGILAKATAKSIEETKETIDANLKKEADVKKDAKEQGSLLWRYTAGWLGY